jgi:CDP-paratose 2-epimerase
MPVLITGGCGFIGTNLAHRLMGAGRPVHLFDNLSRAGSETNLGWLKQEHPELVTSEIGDLRDGRSLGRALANASEIFHLAGREGAAEGLADPLLDFEVNARGTLNLLQAIRASGREIPLVHLSTSKFYAPLPLAQLRSDSARYKPLDPRFAGFDESRLLEPSLPSSCSKAAAEAYVTSFARVYRLPAVAIRCGSVYGPHQNGAEEEQWTAHLATRVLRNMPVTVYGDGKQVRDLLFVEDLVDALLLARSFLGRLRGNVFNVAGGPERAVSLLEFLDTVGTIAGRLPRVKLAPWRCADSRYSVTNSIKFLKATGWQPKVGVRRGIERLVRWIIESRQAPAPFTLLPGPGEPGKALMGLGWAKASQAGKRS